jgi:hypothetical protein
MATPTTHSSLQLQMRGQYVVLNCMSHFHGMLRLLLEHGGCGFVRQPQVICLDGQVCGIHPNT